MAILRKECEVKGPWLCKESSIGWYANLQSTYGGARVLGSNGYYAGSTFPQTHLYNECMVQVLVDDKQAPVVAGLQDITVYRWSTGEAVRMQEPSVQKVSDSPYGRVQSKTARHDSVHGYYGGSTCIVNHTQVMIVPIRRLLHWINGLRSIVEHGCCWIAWMRLEK
ncbi:MAG: hypothetical protein IPF93_22230 [Saprospiraceae bacterium]|nr:hypothetical protein [Saprospiraceae bacterium]